MYMYASGQLTVSQLLKGSPKCKIYKVYMQHTCSSSTLAQSNILQYIFGWASALHLHNLNALNTKLV